MKCPECNADLPEGHWGRSGWECPACGKDGLWPKRLSARTVGRTPINTVGLGTYDSGEARVHEHKGTMRFCTGSAAGIQAVEGREVWVTLSPGDLAEVLSAVPLAWFDEEEEIGLHQVIRALRAADGTD